MLKPLRAGVIGVGHLGQHHARHYAGLPGAVLAGVCDADGARAKMIADRHGAQAWTSLDELLRHVDLVSVAVPTVAHFAAAKACLEAGKHVLVEKPIAATATEARNWLKPPRATDASCRSGIASGSIRSCNRCGRTSSVPPSSKAIG